MSFPAATAPQGLNKAGFLLCDSLKDTKDKVLPYFEDTTKKDMQDGKRVLIAEKRTPCPVPCRAGVLFYSNSEHAEKALIFFLPIK